MPGNLSEKRNHLTAIKAARLKREGRTYTEIAEATGIPVERVAVRIELGERLLAKEASQP